MSAMPTVDDLLELVHRYYPSGIDSHDPRYDSSPETQRRRAITDPERQALEQGRRDTKWASFKRRLHREFPGSVWDTSPPLYDPCHRVRVVLPNAPGESGLHKHVVALVSLLAPVYAIYASHERDSYEISGEDEERWVKFPPLPVEFQEHEARLAALIEDEFEFVRLPHDVLFTAVPDLVPLSNRDMGEAHLIDLLFTPYRS